MLLVELAAGEVSIVDGGFVVPTSGIGGAVAAGGGKGGSVGRYTAPAGARHGRFSVDVTRLSGSNHNTSHSLLPTGVFGATLSVNGNGYTSGSEDGSGFSSLNSSTDSFKAPFALSYTAKTAVCYYILYILYLLFLVYPLYFLLLVCFAG